MPAPASGGFARAALSGWSLDAFVLARSAPPVDVVSATFNSVGKIFNKAAFTAAPNGQQGNFGRNVLRGFNAAQADIGIQRIFRATENFGLRFRAEFFNILNHPNFAKPTNTLTSGLFGRSTQTLANGLGLRWRERGFQPALSDRRTSIGPVGAEASILKADVGF